MVKVKMKCDIRGGENHFLTADFASAPRVGEMVFVEYYDGPLWVKEVRHFPDREPFDVWILLTNKT